MVFHDISLNKLEVDLKADFRSGLSEAEARKRLQELGSNQLPEKKPPTSWQILIEQFKSPLVYILLFAFLISLLLAHWEDALVISGALLLNTVLGYFQEKKALNILEELKKMVHPTAKVLREGHIKEIDASQVVSGDIILLASGDKIPADARLFEENDLEIIEAALTGESVPSAKNINILSTDTPTADRENMVFMGTVVGRGKGRAVVVNTGEGTELGKIALLVSETVEEDTPLQQQLSHFSILLSRLVGIICLLIFGLGVLQGGDIPEMLATSVAVAVAAIPEGLLVALTVVLALGMQRILKKKGLVRHLIAAETLGSTSVICSDKTGTLTQGEMQVSHVHCGGFLPDGEIDKETHSLALKIGALCNDAVVENMDEELEQWRVIGDSTEKALLLSAVQGGYGLDNLIAKFPRLGELPFNENRKFMATLHEDLSRGERLLMVKGAPELILERSHYVMNSGRKEILSESIRSDIQRSFEALSEKGLRVLAVAYKEWNTSKTEITEQDVADLVYTASVSLKDPLREDARETIELCRQAGITPVLITGDHLLTAKTIAEEAGFVLNSESIIEGRELDQLSDKELGGRVRNLQLYARVSPEHKLRIIDAWQKQGEVVAMTGDGVNDAPALKKADIGVALGSGTEVAKEASDLVLLDDRFSTIVSAVREGRVIFDNLRKIITYLLADSFSEIVLVMGGLLIGFGSPISAAQILWVNLITDGLPHLALTMEPQESDIMERPPRRRRENILNAEMKTIIFLIGLLTDFVLLTLFWLLSRRNLPIELVRTIIFAGLGIDSLIYVFSCKSLRRPLWRINIFSNYWLILAVLGGWLLQLAAIYFRPLQDLLNTVPLPFLYWSYLLIIALVKVLLIELVKEIFIHREAKTI
ncbi:cation-translocating P-type ATPase [Patescibacteria group bacterium]|nr:cation-translocating P-type ATPase [Patescibacteria group bacterium]